MNMRSLFAVVLVGVALLMAGCSTTTNLKLPPNTQARINYRPQAFVSGPIETRPFFWNSVQGVDYVLSSTGDDKVIRKGTLPTRFRIVSIFWPPFAIVYWPFGFACDCYDLTKAEAECCY